MMQEWKWKKKRGIMRYDEMVEKVIKMLAENDLYMKNREIKDKGSIRLANF